MNRTFKLFPDHVQFVVLTEYRNHSKPHWYARTKGTFHTRNNLLKWVLGVMWKYFGIGGRK